MISRDIRLIERTRARLEVELRGKPRRYWIKVNSKKTTGKAGFHRTETLSGKFRLRVGRGHKDLVSFEIDIPEGVDQHAVTILITDTPTGPGFSLMAGGPAFAE